MTDDEKPVILVEVAKGTLGRYHALQLEKACAIALALNRGRLVLLEPPIIPRPEE